MHEMDISLLLKIAGVGLIVSVVFQILSKSGRDEQAMLVSLAGVVIVLLMLVREIAELLDVIRSLFGI
jgi:stage III sporulation protein AC